MAQDQRDEQLFAADLTRVEPLEPRPSAGRSKTFRNYDQHRQFLVPPSLDDWLAAEHPARFISDTVERALDLSAIYDSYEVAAGAPPFEPKMMLKLLLYGYSIGVTSSREIERRCNDDVAFRWLAANETPDYRSIARFRRRHLSATRELFRQVLNLCGRAGLVKLGRVALDGTKIRASASRHKAMSYDRMGRRADELAREVDALLAEAEAIDLAEDAEFGEDRRGDEVPPEIATKEGRIKAILAAKAAIEAEARDKAAAEARAKAESAGKDAEEIANAGDKAASTVVVSPKAQRNFTDPDARIMKTADGSFHYCYNAQAVVDEANQVIIATHITQSATDIRELVPMMEEIAVGLAGTEINEMPRLLLADAGYFSKDNLEAAKDNEIDLLIATGRVKHHERVPKTPRGRIRADATSRERMVRRLRTRKGRADYARRKAIVEPVFGQMKTRQHAGAFRLRSFELVQEEWLLHALCHNMRKLANANMAVMVT
jgi:transposase